ncbi:subunit 17 of mediator complex-domain-containing protein [Boletus edulis BED1]|uniref:Mediator of RNA polymerase II transcription subunit 17 n=1 Tax=Boletus edulis BED1 TaxID=1328754 RepID=A0AAD4C680_BOLED|nr:subunit 17 of mediator complex-domain-containing protein [Boletus edulis BED1]
MSAEPDWKKTKLSLERPHKDDSGARIPVLLDITPEGEQIVEPYGIENPTTLLGENLRRIFVERGVDFFERQDQLPIGDELVPPPRESSPVSEDGEHTTDNTRLTMSPEQLLKMRMVITPQLFIALGEMTQARDLLSFLLSSTIPNQSSPVPSLSSTSLTASMVSKPQAISSVDAFNAQLTIGGKDEALRKAADVFKQAASKLERTCLHNEKYWVDALKIRKANWSLVPAPLPVWAPSGKGADRTSKDFLISFGLEESPKHFRRKAVAHLSTHETEMNTLIFSHRQSARLRISLAIMDSTGVTHSAHNTVEVPEKLSLETSLTGAQREVVDEEMFSVLIREASSLPTSSARVAERIIIIDVDHDTELRFEMVDVNANLRDTSCGPQTLSATCDLIHAMLQTLLLAMHAGDKSKRVSAPGSERPSAVVNPQSSSELLQPVIDLLQYQQFCVRIKTELDKMVSALTRAGVPCTLRFHPVGEIGQSLQRRLTGEDVLKKVGGEALLRIDERQTLRLTFLSPSSLIAHLPQATLPITSVPQLSQLLSDEVEKCLLTKLCECGSQYSERFGGTWFVDMVSGKTIGRWEGCIVNFSVSFADNFAICSSAHRIGRGNENQMSHVDTYSPHQPTPLMSWQLGILEKIVAVS